MSSNVFKTALDCCGILSVSVSIYSGSGSKNSSCNGSGSKHSSCNSSGSKNSSCNSVRKDVDVLMVP